MLITELKNKDLIRSQLQGKVFVLLCHGCSEIRFPEKEADELVKELAAAGVLTGSFVTDYICNEENLQLRLRGHMASIEAADTILLPDNTDVKFTYDGKRISFDTRELDLFDMYRIEF